MTPEKRTHAFHQTPPDYGRLLGHGIGHSHESPLRLRVLSTAVQSGQQCCTGTPAAAAPLASRVNPHKVSRCAVVSDLDT